MLVIHLRPRFLPALGKNLPKFAILREKVAVCADRRIDPLPYKQLKLLEIEAESGGWHKDCFMEEVIDELETN